MTSSLYPEPPFDYINNYYSINKGPPIIPKDNIYSCFGKDRKINENQPSLVDIGKEQLFTIPINYKIELPKLLNLAIDKISTLLSLLGSNKVDVLSSSRSILQKLGDDLSSIYINILYLVNEYRSHQAREIVIQLKRKQVNERKELVIKIRNQIKEGKDEIIKLLDDMFKDDDIINNAEIILETIKPIKVRDYIDKLTKI